MNIFLLALKQSLILALLGTIGYYLSKLEIISDEGQKCISGIVTYVGIPALIFNSITSNATNIEFNLQDIVLFVLLFFAASLIAWGIGFASGMAVHLPEKSLPVWEDGLIFSNSGIIGLVIANALYTGEVLIYSSVLPMLMNILMITAGTWILVFNSKDERFSFNYKRLILDPCVLVSVLSCVVLCLNISVPKFIGESFQKLAELNTPLALFLIGATLEKSGLRKAFGDAKIYLFVLLRNLVLPLLLLMVCKLLCNNYSAVTSIIIGFSAPCAITLPIFARRYNCDHNLASKMVLLSVIFSIVSIPAAVFLIDAVLS